MKFSVVLKSLCVLSVVALVSFAGEARAVLPGGSPSPVRLAAPPIEDLTEGGGGGGGTPDCVAPTGFIKIITAQDLSNIRYNLSGNYFLCNDIYLSGLWEPIGSGVNNPGPFLGTFDGNNKKIRDLSIDPYPSSGEVYIGLFGASGGTIKNLTIQNPSIIYGGPANSLVMGALVGHNFFSGEVQNCFVTGEGTVAASNVVFSSLGGLVGYNNGGTINNSAVIGTDITVSAYEPHIQSHVGGLVGRSRGNVSNSYSNATVMCGDGFSSDCGGLAGDVQSGSLIKNSHAIGNVTSMGYDSGTGGLVGSLSSNGASIKKSYATGNVVAAGSGGGSAGGLAGNAFESCSIEDSYAIGDVQAFGYNTPAGGLVGDLEGYDQSHIAKVTRSYATGHVSGPPNYTHGLVGYTYLASVTASFFNKDANPASQSGLNGIGKTGLELRTLSTFTTELSSDQRWDMTYTTNPSASIWKLLFPDGSAYPKLSSN